MTTTKYQPEIDGLRAIAVISVLVFHTFADMLPGGFVGVDIFFVISGFLITQIIFQELQLGTFSLWGFYQRRIRRIFPALLLVFLTSTILGWVILTPFEYELYGTHMLAGAGFVPNIIFWRDWILR
jgi:peptidoglycan/LPS O-acetylase OafA/YrhL